MSASALFAKNGDFYIPVTVQLAQIPRGDRTAAWLVYSALVNNLRPGQTVLGERFTDRVLRQSPWLHGYSYRFVQKGLHVLEQWGIIKRERGHGRRIITFTGRLRPSGKTARPEPKSPDKPKPKPKPGPAPGPDSTPLTPEQIAAADRALQQKYAQAQAEADDDPEIQAQADQWRQRGAELARNAQEKAKAKQAKLEDQAPKNPEATRAEVQALIAGLAAAMRPPEDHGKPHDPSGP